jgi:N-acetylmuramoyl-L-alanine amidase
MPWSKFAIAVLAVTLPAGTSSTAQQSPPAPPVRFVVVLDAAHGGDDTGGHLDSGQLEKAVNLALGVRLRSLLGARGMQVVTIREADTSADPNKRAEIANHANASVCLALHATESGSGIHIFASSLPPAQSARFPAWKTAQAAWITRSLALAGVLNSALTHAGFNVTLGRTSLPGLDSMTCPALAVEIAPERGEDNKITAEPDAADYQARVATALAAAMVQWRTEGRPQ